MNGQLTVDQFLDALATMAAHQDRMPVYPIHSDSLLGQAMLAATVETDQTNAVRCWNCGQTVTRGGVHRCVNGSLTFIGSSGEAEELAAVVAQDDTLAGLMAALDDDEEGSADADH